ncbi:MAG: hypothetical protein LBL42_03750 [Tannerella sp.]|jgi:hypothetical protein|nr:hypothetical protein [Tannerella sp.]
MIRTVFTPDTNRVSLSIPDRYVGRQLEITVLPLSEPATDTSGADPSFGAWADMEPSTGAICREIRAGRKFRNRALRL